MKIITTVRRGAVSIELTGPAAVLEVVAPIADEIAADVLDSLRCRAFERWPDPRALQSAGPLGGGAR